MKPYYEDDRVTLYLGDCREVTEWLAADVLVTDPPYGMSYDSGRVKGRSRPVANDGDARVRDAALGAWGGARPAVVFGTWRVPRPWGTTAVIVWDKTDGVGPGMGNLDAPFGSSHEEVYLIGSWKRPGGVPRQGSVIRSSVAMGGPNGLVATSGHPTPKPVALMERIITTVPDGVIADPFAGSGSTLVAARNLGRRAVGVELEERYCEVIAKRLAQDYLDLGGVS